MTQRVPRGAGRSLVAVLNQCGSELTTPLGDNTNRLVVKIFFAMYSSLPPLFSIQPARRSYSMPSA